MDLRSLLRAPGRLVAGLRREQANRRTYRKMMRMSDLHLRDVGLTRDDVLNALSRPRWSDDI